MGNPFWQKFRKAITGFGRQRSIRREAPVATPAVLACVSPGATSTLLQSIGKERGWRLTLSAVAAGPLNGIEPPIVIIDQQLAPATWHSSIRELAAQSPRPYVILLAPRVDSNLVDEFQRLGGSDILRTPATRDSLVKTVERGWSLWRSQQQLHEMMPLRTA